MSHSILFIANDLHDGMDDGTSVGHDDGDAVGIQVGDADDKRIQE